MGGLDFVVHGAAFAKREDLSAPFSQTSRDGFAHGARHQRLLAGRAHARRAAADGQRGGGSMLTLTLSRRRARAAELQRDGRGQGRARRLGALSAVGPRSAEHSRQRDVGRAGEDARRRRHLRLLGHPQRLSRIARRCAATPSPAKSATRGAVPDQRRRARASPAKSSTWTAATTSWACSVFVGGGSPQEPPRAAFGVPAAICRRAFARRPDDGSGLRARHSSRALGAPRRRHAGGGRSHARCSVNTVTSGRALNRTASVWPTPRLM